MANIIITVVLICLVGSACYYIFKNKKKGVKCIGCPYAQSCGGGCGEGSDLSRCRDRENC